MALDQQHLLLGGHGWQRLQPSVSYFEGKTLGPPLGLITNGVVLWNTIYMQVALDHLKQNGMPIMDYDAAMLSPLRHKHMNVLGHYYFTLSDAVLAGEHRALNQLTNTFSEDLKSLLGTLDPKSDE